MASEEATSVTKIGSGWRSTLQRGAATIASATAVSRVLGYGREFLMAQFFGTSMATDAWLMASVLPNLLFGALNGAVANLVVPLYVESRKSAQPGYSKAFLQEVFTLITVLATAIGLGGFMEAPRLIHALAPGFSGPEYALTVSMTRIMMPTVIFWLWAGLFSALLQALDFYAPPAWAPVVMNIVRITAIVTLSSIMGIRGVAWGFTAGVVSQVLILLVSLYRYRVPLQFRWSLNHPLTRRLMRLAVPVIVTSLTGAIGLIVDRIFASGLATGTIAALNYSMLLVQLPLGLIVQPLVTPVFTRLSHLHSDGHVQDWQRLLRKSGLGIGLIAVSTAGVMFLFRNLIIHILYQHGAFNQHSTTLTVGILPFFEVGLFPMALSQLLTKSVLSLQQTKFLPLLTLVSTSINVTADILLIHALQGRGLALGTSLAAYGYTAGLGVVLLRQSRGSARPASRRASGE